MIEIESRGVPIKAWVEGVPVEDAARVQLQNIAALPVVGPHVAVMPDVHLGKGATVGSVVPTRGAIIPAAVGVDIGCGMMAVKLNLRASDLPDSLGAMRSAIEAAVPHGRTNKGGAGDRGAWGEVPSIALQAWMKNRTDFLSHKSLMQRYVELGERHPRICQGNDVNHLGTLGSGNHFIEVCLDTDQSVWVMLHSGSRGVGNRIGSHFIRLAKDDMRAAHGNLPEDEDLAYLTEGTEHFDDYVRAVGWAQDFAFANRAIMMERTIDAIEKVLEIPFAKAYAVTGDEDLAVNCFAGETKVITRNGTFKFKDMVGTEPQLLTAGGSWVTAPVRAFGVQRLWRLTLRRNGVIKEIYATEKHGWYVAPVQRKHTVQATTAELQPGDRLASVYPERLNTKLDRTGVAAGFVFGDGSCSSKTTARAAFCGEKIVDMLPWFEGLGHPVRHYDDQDVISGLPRTWKLEMPSVDSSPDYIYGWLAGYFAADGDVDKTGRPTLSSINRAQLEHVRVLCSSIGIGTFGIRETLRVGYGTEATSLYLLGFMRNDLNGAFYLRSAHRARCNRVAERRSWTVVNVEATDRVEEVFCATVEGTHNFALDDNILTRNCHHNYVTKERHFGEDLYVTRKGAVNAELGRLGIIPGSMGTKSFIVRGKGNAQSFNSCSHGAGRSMSRNEAKRRFTVADHVKATEGIECRKDAEVVDETPAAYKSIDNVMLAQRDLVEVVATLKQVLCVKG